MTAENMRKNTPKKNYTSQKNINFILLGFINKIKIY